MHHMRHFLVDHAAADVNKRVCLRKMGRWVSSTLSGTLPICASCSTTASSWLASQGKATSIPTA